MDNNTDRSQHAINASADHCMHWSSASQSMIEHTAMDICRASRRSSSSVSNMPASTPLLALGAAADGAALVDAFSRPPVLLTCNSSSRCIRAPTCEHKPFLKAREKT